jgi:hypothetical protein
VTQLAVIYATLGLSAPIQGVQFARDLGSRVGILPAKDLQGDFLEKAKHLLGEERLVQRHDLVLDAFGRFGKAWIVAGRSK